MKPTAPPRAVSMREEEKRPVAWAPPPNNIIAGIEDDPIWRFKWVNVSFQGDTLIIDSMYANRIAQGWTPVDPKDHPKLQGSATKHMCKDGKFVRPGQVLMKMEKAMAQSRNEYWQRQSQQQRNKRMSAEVREHSGVSGFDVTDTVRSQTYIGDNVRDMI